MKIIHNQRLAGYLMYRGFVLQGLEKSNIDSRKNIFLFKDSDEIRLAVSDFKRDK